MTIPKPAPAMSGPYQGSACSSSSQGWRRQGSPAAPSRGQHQSGSGCMPPHGCAVRWQWKARLVSDRRAQTASQFAELFNSDIGMILHGKSAFLPSGNTGKRISQFAASTGNGKRASQALRGPKKPCSNGVCANSRQNRPGQAPCRLKGLPWTACLSPTPSAATPRAALQGLVIP